MFWCEHIYVAFSTIYVGYLTLRRKSAYLRRKKISCWAGRGHRRGGATVGCFITLCGPRPSRCCCGEFSVILIEVPRAVQAI